MGIACASFVTFSQNETIGEGGRELGSFNVGGGPITEDEHLDALDGLVVAATRGGAEGFRHDPARNVYGFAIDAPTTEWAFAAVGDVFRPLFGDRWWVEVLAARHYN